MSALYRASISVAFRTFANFGRRLPTFERVNYISVRYVCHSVREEQQQQQRTAAASLVRTAAKPNHKATHKDGNQYAARYLHIYSTHWRDYWREMRKPRISVVCSHSFPVCVCFFFFFSCVAYFCFSARARDRRCGRRSLPVNDWITAPCQVIAWPGLGARCASHARLIVRLSTKSSCPRRGRLVPVLILYANDSEGQFRTITRLIDVTLAAPTSARVH